IRGNVFQVIIGQHFGKVKPVPPVDDFRHVGRVPESLLVHDHECAETRFF
ncbi:hypothetical protein AZZ74_001585, partial [Klebsiella pneumoniae]